MTTLMFYYAFVSNFSVVFQLKEGFSILRFLTLAEFGIFILGTRAASDHAFLMQAV